MRMMWNRFTGWYRLQGRALQIGLGCGALVVVCLICSVGALALGAGGKGAKSNSPTASSTQQVAQRTSATPTATAHRSTPTPKPTATPTRATPPPTTGSSVLGGPGQAFIARYGPLTNQSNQAQGDLHFREYPGVALDYLIVDEGNYFAITPGGAAAYSIVVAAPSSQPWSLTTARQACTSFMPTDAHHVQQVPTTDGWDDVHVSATLGKTFPASAFQDASQNAAPVGSFDIDYLYASTSDTTHIVSCQLLVGEQQTQG